MVFREKPKQPTIKPETDLQKPYKNNSSLGTVKYRRGDVKVRMD